MAARLARSSARFLPIALFASFILLSCPGGADDTPDVFFLSVVPGDGSLTLHWADPDATGLERVRIDCAGERSVEPGVETCTIDGLANGVEYDVGVRALYAGGAASSGIERRAIPGGVIVRSNPQTLHVAVRYTVVNTGLEITRMGICFPIAFSSPYQDVWNHTPSDSTAEILPVDESDNFYFRYRLDADSAPAVGETLSWGWDCDVTIYDIATDFGAIGTIRAYDTTTELYRRYTAARGVWIDPSNATLAARSAEFLALAGGDWLEYARLSGNWVGQYLTYVSPHTNESLADVIASAQGDCGCHAALLVSLLRAGGVPARMLVARTDDTGHAWVEFYLEGYGWIPIESTAKNPLPGDSMGTRARRFLVMSDDQEQELVFFEDGDPGGALSWTASVLQSGYMFYKYSGGEGTVTGTYSFAW